MEQFAEDAELLAALRAHLQTNAMLVSVLADGKEDAAAKFRDYFDYQEALRNVPPHRALALFRGRKEDMLKVSLKLPEDIEAAAAAGPGSFNADFTSSSGFRFAVAAWWRFRR